MKQQHTHTASTGTLDKPAQNGDNTATTKQIAVQPNRHTLAFFVLDLLARLATSQKTPYSDFTVYGGLIGVNKTPVKGNSPSRLFAVVETRQPFLLGWQILTKQIGNNAMTNLLARLATNPNPFFYHFNPLTSLALVAVLGLLLACLFFGFLSVMGV